MRFFLSVLGLVLVIEGIPYFCFPNQIKTVVAEKIQKVSSRNLRILGLGLMLLGLSVIYVGSIFIN